MGSGNVSDTACGTKTRVLALDLGERRIGVAISDELGLTAQGLRTLYRTNKRRLLATLAALAAERQVGLILVGYPLLLSGEEGSQAQRARRFAAELERRTGLPVKLLDERFTTVEARRLLRSTGVCLDKRNAPVVDRLSAVLLLQAYLDSRAVGERG